MVNKRRFLYRLIMVLLIMIFLQGWGSLVFSDSHSQLLTDNKSIPKEFIRRQGNQLVVGADDRPILLRGVCFTNNIFWGNIFERRRYHHNETDFQRIREMHMNVIRFYMHYSWFEDDGSPYRYKKSGWAWLDQNIRWAKNNNVYLILDMHFPQGGYQSGRQGMALWEVPENQRRLIALWRAIAERYQNEPIIAGYDLLNEPITSSSLDQWRNLANRIAEAIRTVDRNHLLIVERLNGINLDWSSSYKLNFFLLNDSNTMYTFHFYLPYEYSHQNSWARVPADGSYPDPNEVLAPADVIRSAATVDNPIAPSGNSPWTYYEGIKYQVTDPRIILGKPVLVAHSTGKNGKVYFDGFVIKEYDKNRIFVKDVCKVNFTLKTGRVYPAVIPSEVFKVWSYWSKNKSGKPSMSILQGHSGITSIKISDTTDDAYCSNNSYRFKITTGHYYQICGWMKGKNLSPEAKCQYRIDFESSPSGGQVYGRNKEYLESALIQFLDFGTRNNVPLFCGEFGLNKDCFYTGKGGLNWVADIVDLFISYGLHFTYHTYNEWDWGIYRNDNGLPDPAQANKELVDLLTDALK